MERDWSSRLGSHSSRPFNGVTVNLFCHVQFSLSPVHELPELIKHFLPGLFIDFVAKAIWCPFACIRGAPWSHCSWLFCHNLAVFFALAYVCFSLHPQLFLLVLLPLWRICDFMCFSGSSCLIQICDSTFNCCKIPKSELINGNSDPPAGNSLVKTRHICLLLTGIVQRQWVLGRKLRNHLWLCYYHWMGPFFEWFLFFQVRFPAWISDVQIVWTEQIQYILLSMPILSSSGGSFLFMVVKSILSELWLMFR